MNASRHTPTARHSPAPRGLGFRHPRSLILIEMLADPAIKGDKDAEPRCYQQWDADEGLAAAVYGIADYPKKRDRYAHAQNGAKGESQGRLMISHRVPPFGPAPARDRGEILGSTVAGGTPEVHGAPQGRYDAATCLFCSAPPSASAVEWPAPDACPSSSMPASGRAKPAGLDHLCRRPTWPSLELMLVLSVPDWAILRARSIKRSASGVSVRSLTVTNPTGAGGDEVLTDRTWSRIPLPPNRITEAGTRPSQRPVSISRM
jgi:hypothetical protein